MFPFRSQAGALKPPTDRQQATYEMALGKGPRIPGLVVMQTRLTGPY
jgi:hypothetical protein